MSSALDVTTMSSKGQVVIPTDIRKELGLLTGAKLMVLTDGSNLLLKPMQTPKLQTFQALIRRSRHLAKIAGLRKSAVAKALRKIRHEGRA
ncbi:MAG: AbrB/MazE/SpoVT family DNA-binding domain-containing protein [Candidatus Omnitrophica bacterium]|nr:AbrB/MazE/SpoVT family DNA-binding domain-containing protein [Candidatus Omnitrophota bacterium]